MKSELIVLGVNSWLMIIYKDISRPKHNLQISDNKVICCYIKIIIPKD